jgi:deoxyribodipyrimidine photolyase-related protein
MKTLVIILGNQLFEWNHYIGALNSKNPTVIFMREDIQLCTYYKFHKHKILFFLSSMRNYKDKLIKQKLTVHYDYLEKDNLTYEESLLKTIKKYDIKLVQFFEIEDKFFESRIINLLNKESIEYTVFKSPMFLCSREDFKKYLNSTKKPFLKTFYEGQRKNLKILIDDGNKPIGGKWSFDTMNRKPLPSNLVPPNPIVFPHDKNTKDVIEKVNLFFTDHPGNCENFYLPCDRQGALSWLDDFLKNRFEYFGPYEDAFSKESDFVFHSFLTPFLNNGLLTPNEIIEKVLFQSKISKLPLESLEGFIRQLIGWREFMRGIYQNYSDRLEKSNFFNHNNKLSNHWYKGNSGIPPLDNLVNKLNRIGYSHHIERLMIAGSLMLLLEIHPQEAYKWFMEMYIDSSDWVMSPNVFGMGIFSVGNLFATKPYFCGSNYYKKMGMEKSKSEWMDGIDGLYWRFVDKNRSFLSKNPRTSMMVKTYDKMPTAKKSSIHKNAEETIKLLTFQFPYET